MADSQRKACSRCGQVKPITEFDRRPGGRIAHCKACQYLRRKRWRLENPERHCALNCKWYFEHKPEVQLSKRAYRERNEDRIRREKREYHEANRERICDKTRRWNKVNRDKRAITTNRREARKLNLPDQWTKRDADAARAMWKNECAACGTPLGLLIRCHWDHWIPLVHPECPGTVPHNMLPLCETCNCSKSSRPGAEWLVDRFGPNGRRILKRITNFLHGMQPSNERQMQQ